MKQKHFFLIGIGGVGMQGLAELLQCQGHTVSGSDMKEFAAREQMIHKGIEVTIGHGAKNIASDVDEVIISAAIPATNPEIKEAKKRQLPIRRRLELVGDVMEKKTGIAISGTHGKTTTTKMITMILQAAGRDPTSLIGAEVKNLSSNVVIGNGPEMVVEGCEYRRSFLDLRPKIAVITNIEADHLDCYKDLDDIKSAFKTFALSVPKKGGVIIANGDDEDVRDVLKDIDTKIIFVGFKEGNDLRATNLEFREGRLHFSINGERLYLQIPGRHHVADAVLAWSVARYLGIDDLTIKHVLQDEFKGVERRFQLLGTVAGITFMDDYAHHPTEIKATLEGMREYFGDRRLIVVFHPHQFSRTRLLLNDFATSFNLADLVIVAPIYAVRDSEKDKKSVSAEILVEAINKAGGNGSSKASHLGGRATPTSKKSGGQAKFVGDFLSIKKFVTSELKAGDVLITLGAGEANLCGAELLKHLRDK